eukprot:5714885-Prymnesium_polylepis.1
MAHLRCLQSTPAADAIGTRLAGSRPASRLSWLPSGAGGAFIVQANVSLEERFVDAATRPAGGLRLRLRAPSPHAGRLVAVTVGSVAWPHFDAAEETVDFAPDALGVLAKSPLVTARFSQT